KRKIDFMTECRAGAPTTTTQAAPSQTQSEPSATEAAPQTAPRTAPRAQPRTGQATQAGQFTTEAAARSHCPGAPVVWANTKSNIYHFAGTHNYGNTKAGSYMCEADAAAAGIRAAKNEKRPS